MPKQDVMVVVRPSNVEEFQTHALSLLRMHWRELAIDQDEVPLEPDWENYKRCEDAGILQAFAAWVDNEMVGYTVTLLVRKHLHYASHCYAQNDVFFVHPDYRGLGVHKLLADNARKAAREAGAREYWQHVKEGSRMHRILDRSKRHIVRDIIYSEKL